MITRRQFLTYGGGALASASFSGLFPKYVLCKPSPKVCIIKSPRIWQNGSIDQEEVGLMLEAGIRMLSGTDDHAKAWKTYFAVNDTIALKVNPIARQTGSTKPEICYALAKSIHENVGVPFDKFIIFDVSKDDLIGAGYEITDGRGRVQIYSSKDYSEMISMGGVKAKLSRIITDQCTALISMPLLKTHKGAGISIALKNHYGSIPTAIVRDDANRYHMDQFKNLVFLNLMPPIYDKTRLIVVDGLVAQYNRGPGGDPRYQWKLNGIIMGTDPVAVDAVCAQIINQKRAENSLQPLDLPYLDWARQEGLGMNRLEEILIYEKVI
jgi:uncharacterized protein (DUF362 family)